MTELNLGLLQEVAQEFWAIKPGGKTVDTAAQTLAQRHNLTIDRVMDLFGLCFDMEIIRGLYGPDPSPAPPEIMKLIRQAKRRGNDRPKAPKQTPQTALSLDTRSWRMWREGFKK